MKAVKGFKLANIVLVSAIALALTGCDGDDLLSHNPPSAESPITPPTGTTPPPGTDILPAEKAGVIFGDVLGADWSTFDCCGGLTPTSLLDTTAGRGMVMEFVSDIEENALGFQTSKALDLSEMATTGTLEFGLKVVAFPENAGTDWVVKVESNGGDGPDASGEGAEIIITGMPAAGVWKDFSFPLADFESLDLDLEAIDKVMVFPAWGNAAGAVYRLDDVFFAENAEEPDDPDTDTGIKLDLSAAMADFGGAVTVLATNPASLTRSVSPQVVKTTKPVDAMNWAGTTMGDTTILPITADRSIVTVWVYSPESGIPVLLKVETSTNPDGGPDYVEVETHTSVAEGWEKLTFDFNLGTVINPELEFTKKSIFFDFLGDTSAEQVFYWDDVTFVDAEEPVDPVDPDVHSVIDFEGDTQLTWETFENVDNPTLEFVANPDNTGINSSASVAEFTARVDGAPWAGTQTFNYTPFTLDANSTIKIMVYKETISDVGIKLATATGWAKPELKVANTKINEWEELTFDVSVFGNHPDGEAYSTVVVFPDFAARTGETVTYFDNITFNSPD
ncbi:MAG: hypothetical protein V7782_11330 [Psychromonas sp.]